NLEFGCDQQKLGRSQQLSKIHRDNVGHPPRHARGGRLLQCPDRWVFRSDVSTSGWVNGAGPSLYAVLCRTAAGVAARLRYEFVLASWSSCPSAIAKYH